MYRPRTCSIGATSFLFLLLFGCASTTEPTVDSDIKPKEIDFYGLRPPEYWEIFPADIEMQWNNMRLLSVCDSLPEISLPENVDRWQTRFYWYYILWGQLPEVDYCKALSVKEEGKLIAKRVGEEGRLNELLKICQKTENYVEDLLNKGYLADDLIEGARRELECVRK